MKKLLFVCMLLANHTYAQLPVLVKDIVAGAASGDALDFYAHNNLVMFTASAATDRGLWISDGTDAGTTLLLTAGGGGPFRLLSAATLNGEMIYAGIISNGTELWKTNGTTPGSTLIKDINTTTPTDGSNPKGFTLYNGKAYFVANDGVHGPELWVTDGTTAGTQMLMDIDPGAIGSHPSLFTVLNGKLYFTANTPAEGRELWVTDGTPAGTALFKDITAGAINNDAISMLTVFKNKLYFYHRFGNELWVCDGTPAGTIMLKDLAPGVSAKRNGLFKECNGKLFFVATNTDGRELWVTDGTVPGTKMTKDINTAAKADGVGLQLVAYKNKLYFAGNDGNGFEPWVSDGTAAGTVMLKDLKAGGGSDPDRFTEYNGRLYFAANEVTNKQLWVTDGKADSTKVVTGPNTAHPISDKSTMLVAGGKLFFTGTYDAALGSELYSLTTPDYAADVKQVAAVTDIMVYPNPAKESITLQYTLTKAGSLQYRLYDMAGRCVATWHDAGMLTGTQSRQLDISNLASAMYQLQIEVNGKMQTVNVVKQ